LLTKPNTVVTPLPSPAPSTPSNSPPTYQYQTPIHPTSSITPSPPNKKPRYHLPPVFSPGELGKFARQCAKELARSGGWSSFYPTHFHRNIKSIHPLIYHLPHPAAPFLARLASNGVPAPSRAPPWTVAQQDAAVTRGPHPSAAHYYASFLLEDLYDYVRMGYWLVLPYSSLRGHPTLCIAPAGVVPQRDRRPRPIMDYSFNGVNQSSLPLAPPHAMQFGQAFQRILQRLAYANPKYGPPLMAKIDLADGYYRIPLSASAALRLAVILPSDGLPEPMLGVPLSLPMGWSESPPFFCAFTETCADLANNYRVHLPTHNFQLRADADVRLPIHDSFLPTAIWPYQPKPPDTPLHFTEVYLDDFMVLAQAPLQEYAMTNLLHHLSSIFHDPPESPRRGVVSASKVSKGDATFSTTKRILGWDVDTHRMEVRLPAHRMDRLGTLLQTFLHRKCTARRKWQKLLGELRSMALALHSSKYLFSTLQTPLQRSNTRRFRLNSLLKQSLRDWMALLNSMTSLPIPIATLVPRAPHYWAATDASSQGLGGFWFPTTLVTDGQPVAWRLALSPNIKARLLSSHNPTGDITINDLELAAVILGHSTQMSSVPPYPSTHTCIATDNTTAQAWLHNGSPTTTGPPAFLLRQLASDCRTWGCSLYPIYAPGATNTVADFLSRSFDLSDADVLTHLQRLAPVQPPWKLATLPVSSICNMNWALSKQLPPEGSPQAGLAVPLQPGTSGQNFATACIATLSSHPSMTHSPSFKYSLHDTEWERWLPQTMQSGLERWKVPFVPWGRRSPHWDTPTHACTHRDALTSGFTDNFKPTQKQIHPHTESNQYHCNFFCR
jgi:hypothetical protein